MSIWMPRSWGRIQGIVYQLYGIQIEIQKGRGSQDPSPHGVLGSPTFWDLSIANQFYKIQIDMQKGRGSQDPHVDSWDPAPFWILNLPTM